MYRVLNDIPRCAHTGSRQARCQKTATCQLRRTDGSGVRPWFEYCDACATAIQASNPMTERRGLCDPAGHAAIKAGTKRTKCPMCGERL